MRRSSFSFSSCNHAQGMPVQRRALVRGVNGSVFDRLRRRDNGKDTDGSFWLLRKRHLQLWRAARRQ